MKRAERDLDIGQAASMAQAASRSRLLLAAVCCTAVLGCSSPIAQRRAEAIALDSLATKELQVVTYPTELRGAYVRRDAKGVQYCAEPAPDVAMNSVKQLTETLNLKLKQVEVSGSSSVDIANRALELAGRTQLVLTAREMLYRLCELSMNRSDIPKEEIVSMYGRVASLLESLGKAQQSDAAAVAATARSYEQQILDSSAARWKIIQEKEK